MDYKKVASTRFNSHTINMETGAQRGEDMSKVMSFTFKIHSIISQTMFIDIFLGVCPMLRAVGWEWKRLCHKKEKHKSYSWYQRTYRDLQPTSTSEVPALSLATSLQLSRVVPALRTQLKPNKIHQLWNPFQHTKLCIIYSISFYTHYSPPW